jgi:uncharacterized damage-inducible protein DinB
MVFSEGRRKVGTFAMKRIIPSTIALMLIALGLPAVAQSSVKDALVKHWKTSGEFTIAVADAMPADGYNFRPNPEEMSFGELMAHIAGVNENACSIASGLTKPELPAKIVEWSKATTKVEVSKETAMPFLKESFEFCDKAVAAMTPERMDTVVGPPARNMTGFEWLWAYFTHTAHHRGQAEVYLRVKGIKPPDYRF